VSLTKPQPNTVQSKLKFLLVATQFKQTERNLNWRKFSARNMDLGLLKLDPIYIGKSYKEEQTMGVSP
jgi:hypothetical protein